MLCSEYEIGLGFDNSGVITLSKNDGIKIGQYIWDYFDLKQDYLYEIGLTPNRTDAFGHIGCARDILAVHNLTRKKLNLKFLILNLKLIIMICPFQFLLISLKFVKDIVQLPCKILKLKNLLVG